MQTETEDRRGLRKLAPWIGAFVALVLIVPMATFGKNVLFDQKAGAPTGPSAPVLTAGTPYETAELFSLAVGDGPREADAHDTQPETIASTVEVVAPSPDGSKIWIVDHPQSVKGAARIRSFGVDGRLLKEFAAQPACTIFTPGLNGDLWALQSSGSRRETLINYAADGTVRQKYLMPEGLIGRSISFDPDGRVWVQYEEWIVNPKTNQQEYSSSLTPIVEADGAPVQNVTPEMSADGSFIGPDDRIYWPSTSPGRQPENEYPPFLVIARDENGDNVSEYDVNDGGRPYAADVKGRIYTEEMPDNPGDKPGVATLGDPAYNNSSIGVWTADGEFARIQVTRDPSMGQWAPAVWPTADGTLISWRWDGGRLRVYASRPVEDAKPLVTGGAPKRPAVRVLVSDEAPISGDPYRALDVSQRDLWQAVYAGLVGFDASITPVPDLVESIPKPGSGVSSDGKTITYTMRSGRTFHDGKPVTARDVVATWEYLRSPRLADTSEPFPGFSRITSVSAKGDEVAVTLDEPFGAAPQSLFPFVLPAHILEGAKNQTNGGLHAAPVGAGPYRVARWEADRIQLERVGGAAPGSLSVIEVVFDTTEEDRQRFVTADVPTVWSWVPEEELTLLRRDAVGDITLADTGRWYGLVANTDDRLIESKVLRDAMLAAYPSSVVRDLYGMPSTETVSPFGEPIVVDSGVARKPAVTSLKKALGAVGFVNTDSDPFLEAFGENLRLRYSQTMVSAKQHETLAEVEEEYKRIVDSSGATMDWENGQHNFYAPVSGAGFLSRGRHQIGSGVFPGFVDAGWGSVFDPADTPDWSNPWGKSVTFVDDRELAELHAAARSTYDADERVRIGQRIIERVRELDIALFDRPEIRPVATLGVAGTAPAPFPAGLFHNIEDWRLEEQQ